MPFDVSNDYGNSNLTKQHLPNNTKLVHFYLSITHSSSCTQLKTLEIINDTSAETFPEAQLIKLSRVFAVDCFIKPNGRCIYSCRKCRCTRYILVVNAAICHFPCSLHLNSPLQIYAMRPKEQCTAFPRLLWQVLRLNLDVRYNFRMTVIRLYYNVFTFNSSSFVFDYHLIHLILRKIV